MADSKSFREYRNKSAIVEYLSDDGSNSSLDEDADLSEEPGDDLNFAQHDSYSSTHAPNVKASSSSAIEAVESSDEEVLASTEDSAVIDSEEEVLTVHTAQLPFSSTPRTVVKPPSWGIDLFSPSRSILQPPICSNPDRSRSFRADNDSSECMSPYSSRLAKDPNQQGKLRDRLMRKAVSKKHQKRDSALDNRLRHKTLPPEAVDENVRESMGESPNVADEISLREDDEIVEESLVGQREDDDIIVLDGTSDEEDVNDTKREGICMHPDRSAPRLPPPIQPEVITLSSDDESEKCDKKFRRPSRSPVHFIREVLISEPSSKYKGQSTFLLEEKLSNAQKLLSRRLKLPDKGVRLEKQIAELGDELQRRKTASLERTEHGDVEVLDVTNAVGRLSVNPELINRRQLNINDVLKDEYRPVARAFQEKAVRELHNALMSQPDQTQFTDTPEGLTCPLKEHQKSGLTWLLWRESVAPKGGILADEMGLGKTLSMISLIVSAKAERKRRRREGEDQEDKERRQRIKAKGMIASNATLVVAPAALIYHWEAEVKQRCDEGLLKTVIYHQNRKNLGLENVARSDLVITTYTLLANEVESSYARGRSPSKV